MFCGEIKNILCRCSLLSGAMLFKRRLSAERTTILIYEGKGKGEWGQTVEGIKMDVWRQTSCFSSLAIKSLLRSFK